VSEERAAEFVGGDKCQPCHKEAYDKWRDSHHDLAMDLANEETVLGNFNDTTFEYEGITTRFYRKEGKFLVHTEGPGGEMGEFEITHTFGAYPLQQYLIPFPGGRLQCLSIAWDVEKKEWYRLPPYDVTGPDDWLHWTKAGQNWNGMCAECHSTHLVKGYDYKTDSYKTTWTEIDVGCEACHGPGSLHVEWADRPAMALIPANNYELVVKTEELSPREQMQVCARCHARRFLLSDYEHSGSDLMDHMVPTLLNQGLYYPDGQILEEVYVYGSFMQSKMYQSGVRCSDCHDIHSLKRLKKGNDLCLQCHRADTYNTGDHHFHKEVHEGKPSDGWLCEKCHMPGRYYMGIDYRLDHSIRIPRPDLSLVFNTPNSCSMSGCHDDKSVQWSADHFTKWYGIARKPQYGTILAAGREAKAEAETELIKLADDQLQPVIVRATALSLLSSYPGEESANAFERALKDDEALMRYTAIRNLDRLNPSQRVKWIFPLLYDPVKAVRMQAAVNLTVIPSGEMKPDQEKVFRAALLEYEKAMEYTADFASSRHNLGNMYANLGQPEKAEEQYRKAIQIDDLFSPAKVNLAMVYNQMGKNREAEALIREVLQVQPELYEMSYSLGLLLAEEKRYEEAVEYMERAAKGMPYHARAHYNLGLLLQYLNRPSEAEAALLLALELEPGNTDFLYAMADYYIKAGRWEDARRMAQQMITLEPSNPAGRDILNFIDRTMQGRN
jgi:tetratricopeptide (TPR) repeat protein